MNGTPGRPQRPGNDIDLVSFDRRKRAEQIRNNEDAQREARRREQARRLREERIRRAKIQRMKSLALLAIMGIGSICLVIGIITAIIKFASPAEVEEKLPDGTVPEAELTLVSDFKSISGYYYSENENEFLDTADKMITGLTLSGSGAAGIPSASFQVNEFGELVERYKHFTDSDSYNEIRNYVKNVPIFSNGYIWSEMDSMKSTITGGYMYDTNTSYITAVANICLTEGSVSFLSEVDGDSNPSKDSSQGLTVKAKLERAVDYIFDGNVADGGLKFDTETSLCCIHTTNNNGTSSGTPSNKWYNFRFGYLDAYTNISFNKAMVALSKLYTLLGEPENASKYNAVAKQHAAAFNKSFWDETKQRYIGCIDKSGVTHDNGFVFLNLEAIAAGIADSEKASAIFSWIDGERTVAGDTSTGADIYSYGFAPRNTTLAAEDSWWDYLGGTLPLSSVGGYNQYYQNGGVSLSTAYYDILARYTAKDNAGTTARLDALAKEFEKNSFTSGYESAVYGISGKPVNGITSTAVLKTVFGVDTDGLHLTVNPDISLIPVKEPDASEETDKKNKKNDKDEPEYNAYGVKNITFAGNKYGFLFEKDAVFVTSEQKRAVRLNIGSLEKSTSYDVVVVDGGKEITRTAVMTDAGGILSTAADFGGNGYLRIEKTPQVEEKK